MTADWDPERYARFADDRDAPFRLLASLLEPAGEAPALLDLGCGDGRLTAELAEQLGAGEVLGVDRSPAMLEAARERIPVQAGELATWTTEARHDVVVSNAVLHWLRHHEDVLERWWRLLRPGGQLAVQLPDNRRSLPHRLAHELSGEERAPHTALDPEDYARLLHRLGAERLHVRSVVHPVHAPDTAGLIDWLRGSLLTHYEASMGPGRFAQLLEDLRTRLPEGPVFHPYVRTYLWARAPFTDR